MAVITVLFFPRMHFLLRHPDPILLVIVVSLATLIIYRHKDNIRRMRSKTENLVPWGLNLSRQKKS